MLQVKIGKEIFVTEQIEDLVIELDEETLQIKEMIVGDGETPIPLGLILLKIEEQYKKNQKEKSRCNCSSCKCNS